MKVFLCEKIHPDALALIMTRAEVIGDAARMGEAEAIITRNLRLDAKALAPLDRLRIVAVHGAGTDGIDLEFCKKRGIYVFRTPHENADSVAELIVAMALSLLRKLHLADRMVISGAVRESAPAYLIGSELAGKTVGLIGVGDIARRAARIMRDGFRANIIGYSPSLTSARAAQLGIERCADMREVLERSDIISLGTSLTPQTENLIGAPELALMKPSAILINTSRGAVVDEKALYAALASGTIAAAAADVFRSEPPGPDHPLIGLDNFMALPHIGANTDEALRRVGIKLAKDLFTIMDGGEAEYPCR